MIRLDLKGMMERSLWLRSLPSKGLPAAEDNCPVDAGKEAPLYDEGGSPEDLMADERVQWAYLGKRYRTQSPGV